MFKKLSSRAPFYGGLVLFSLVFFFLPNQQNVSAQSTCALNEYEGMPPFNLTQTTNLYIGNCVFPNLQAYYDGTRTAYFLVGGQSLPLQQEIDFSCWTGGHPRATTPCYFGPDSLFIIRNPMEMVGGYQAEDKVIDYIAANKKVRIQLSPSTEPNNKQTFDDFPATNCVKLSGDGPRKVLFLRTKDWGSSIQGFKDMADDVINRGFRTIQPFSNFFGEFAFYLDLKPGGGSCKEYGGFDINIIFAYQTDKKDLAYAYLESGQAIYNFAQDGRAIFRRICDQFQNELCFPGPYDVRAYIIMHEVGHAFAGLLDEYLYTDAGDIIDSFFSDFSQYSTKNCVKNPTWDYRNLKDNKVYGSVTKTGCSFLWKSESGPRQHPILYYRPSDDSLMKGHASSIPKFNVISCGYIIAAIKGESLTKSNAQKYWPECLEMAKRGTVIMDGIPPVSPTPNTTTPTTNSASAGFPVSINGSGFTSEGNAVQFTNTATGEAYEVLDISSNGSRIDFLVPIDAPPGNYTLKVGAFNSEWAPPTPFTITAVKAPVISLVASPNPVSLGDKTTITWLVQGASSCDSDSTMDKPPVEWSNPGVSGSFSLALADSTEFSLKCAGPGGTASQDLQVNTTISPPLVSLSVTSRNIKVGEGVTIAWSTERAQRCAGVGGGDLAALAAWNKNQPLTGSMYLAPNQTTSLALRCTGIGGTTAVSPVVSILVAPLLLSPVSVSCSVSNASGAYRQLITYTANTTGGDGKYTYNWSSADGLIGADKLVSTYYYNPTNTKAVAYKTANVTASSGGQNATAQCPSIPINASTPVSLIPLPYISSINPLSGSVGAMITLTGSPNNSGLRFNSTTQQSVFVKGGGKTFFVKPYSFGADGYSLNFVLPPLPSSFGSTLDIGVTSGGVGAYESNAVRFTLAAPQIPIPSITSITPSNGTLNTSITLTGKNFSADSAVLIQRDTSTTVVVPRYTPVTPPVVTESLIFTFFPPQVVAGQYDLKVSNKGVLSNAVKFSNTTNTGLPVITLFITPVSGPDGQNKYTLTWGATNAVSCALAVQGEEKGGEDWSGFAGSVGVFGTITNSVTSLTTFTMTCTGPGGTDSKSTTVTPEFELKSDSGNDNLANIISAFKHIFQVVFEPFINLFKIK